MRGIGRKPILILILLVLCVSAARISAAAQSWPNGYSFRRVITIDHSKVSNTDQSNFPVLISGTYADLATTSHGGNVTNANGYDIIFTSDSSGSSALPFEQESYSASTGQINYWVSVPTLSHTSDTIIYMFYGNSSVTTDQSNKTAVWDSNYMGVWHLKETSGQQNDSTSNGNNSTAVSVTAEGTAAGQIDGADQFNAAHPDHVDLPNIALSSAFTLEAWIYPTSYVSYARIFGKAYSSNSAPWIDYALSSDTSSDHKVSVGVDLAGTNHSLISTGTVPLNQWTHIVGIFDGSYLKLYLNGALDSTLAASGSVATVSQTTEIGYNNVYGPQSWTGNLDEVRISSIARSADWIATEYNNQESPSTFYSMGEPNAPNIAGVSPTSGASGTSITITGSGFGDTQGTSTVTFNGTQASPTNWSDTSITVPVPSGATPGDVVVTHSSVESNGMFFMVPSSWSNGYSYRRAITINHAKVSNTNQSNFPVLVSGTYPYLATVSNGGDVTNANGYDIIFTSDAGGTNVLAFERESYDSATGTVNYWVHVPTLSSNPTETVLYMFYGNSAVTTDQSNKTAVWDSNYALVAHLSDNADDAIVADSTTNNNNLTNQANTNTKTATGEINNGLTYNGSSDYSSVSDNTSVDIQGSAITLEAWVKPTNSTASSSERLIVKEVAGNTNPYIRYGLFRASSGSSQITFWLSTGSSGSNASVSGGTTAAGKWMHIVGVYDGSSMRLYTNGTQVGSASKTGNIASSSTPLVLGADTETNAEYFNGVLDEVRVSNIARSADWIATEYNNQSSPSTFFDVRSAYTSSGTIAPTVTSLSPSSGVVGTSVTINGTDFGSTQGSSTVTFNGTTATPTSWSDTAIVVPVPSEAAGGPVVITTSGVSSNGVIFSVVPVITNVSATTGSVGSQVTIVGNGFGSAQGNSEVLLNGVAVTIDSWSSDLIAITLPTGATTGQLLVSDAPNMTNSNSLYFTVTDYPLPTGWLDQDIGTVSTIGSGTYQNGTFAVSGSGAGINNQSSTDGFHFVYEPLAGDGTIIARMDSIQGISSAGLMIRETLSPGSTYYSVLYFPNGFMGWAYRGSTGGNSYEQTISNVSLPYWMKLVRSGNTFTAYISENAIDWTQVGTTETISMATDVYIGLATTSGNSSLATATFDNISFNCTTTPAPVITSVSATTGPVGSQVVISGSGFGTVQGNSAVLLSGTPVTINSWSDTSITITIPSGATSGLLLVSVAPNMNDSNAFYFTVTSQPLPATWLDQDVGAVAAIGIATYSNGTFTVNGSGTQIWSTADSFHFVYQPLSGDGTIVARLVSLQGGGTNEAAGVMVRESFAAGSKFAAIDYSNNGGGSYYFPFVYRTATDGSAGSQSGPYESLPYWIKLVRSGDNFTAYASSNAVDWTQIGTTETISMATNVYIGLVVTGNSTTGTATATFDDVSVSTPSAPAPVISSLSATQGTIGTQVVISGSNFGATQGNSVVRLSGVPMTINSWSDTSITATISSGAGTGLLIVSVGPSMNDSNPVVFTVTTQPLPSGWLDQDVGSVGTAGSAGYAGGTFTVSGAGSLGSTADAFHFAYESLYGDGTIIARVVTSQSNQYPQVGVMMRETLNSDSTFAAVYFYPNQYYLFSRSSTGGAAGSQAYTYVQTLPYWVKLSRNGSTFTAYGSADGVYWTQVATTTVSMAQSIYVGLFVDGGNGAIQTATFDNVTVTSGSPAPTPNITSISPTSGGIGTSVTIIGSNFGATQGSSSALFNGAAATSITSWSDTQIVALVPSNATTGPVTVVANGIGSNSNNVFTFYNPVISSLSPSQGPVGGSITVTGSGFGTVKAPSTTVQFNGVTADWSNWSDTSFVATVPSGATSGPVTVTVGGITSNGLQFAVIETATITGISPASGPVGSTIVISGTGFGSTQNNSTLNFYGAAATNITSWSDTSIQAVVPSGTSTGNISVTVAGITTNGPMFTLTSTVTLTDSLGNSSTYDAAVVGGQWLLTDSQGSGCTTCTVRGANQNTYDSRGNILSTTDPMGHVTTYTYDSLNNLLSETVQVDQNTNATTTYTYNSFGEVLTVTDPLGHTTTNTYDAHGNLTSVTTPAPDGNTPASVTQFAYNSLGELTQITDPLGHNTTMTYTAAGLIATITDAQNNVTTYGYDAHGNRTSVTDAANHQTTFAYDAGDRLTTITYPDSTTTTFTYDSRGRRTSVTDQNGKTTTYTYDDADRLVSVTDPANNVTTYAYDTEDNLTSITDANQHTTFFTYDAFGRVTNANFPSTMSETYTYDADNNLTSKTDRKGQTIQYVYDALNRLTQKTYPDTTTVDYVYDLVGKIMQVNDPTGTYAFAYDNMGRLIGTTTSYSFLTSRNFTTSYTYDAASNRTGFTDPEGGSTAYTYDTLNRLATLVPPAAFGTGSFGFSYDALGRRTQMTRPNNVTTSYTYDNLSRLLSVLHQAGGSTIDGSSYSVDNAGNRTAKTDQATSVTSNYTYDALYQLTQVMQGGNTTESYTYDPVGNRLSSLGVSPYAYDPSNELTSTPSTTYSYDYNGNTVNKTDSSGTTQYAWDYENRLTSVTLPGSGGTVTFKYDPFGRRIEKVSPTGTSIYAYDGDNLIEETDASGAVVARYSQTENVDEPLAMLRAGATSFYEQDGLGSVTSLTNAAGALAQTYTYDSFGKLTASAGSLINPFQYTGREFDAETGLYYYRARYYASTSGRFESEDPIGFEGINLNFYGYVGNSPIDLIDPLGQTAGSNLSFLKDWLRGSGPRDRNYGSDAPQTKEMKNSSGAAVIRDLFYREHCRTVTDVAYGSRHAFKDTILHVFSTAFQVGGFAGASATNNGDGTVTFMIPNVAGTHSFFYHIVPNRDAPNGPMSNIYQTFTWTEPIVQCRCGK